MEAASVKDYPDELSRFKLVVQTATLAGFAIALLLMLVGLAGAVLPLLPGLPLVLAGEYLYALATGPAAGVGLGHLVAYTLIRGAVILLISLANVWGVRAAEGSSAGVLGAMLGPLVGLVLRGPVGLLIGPFVGAMTCGCSGRFTRVRTIRSE